HHRRRSRPRGRHAADRGGLRLRPGASRPRRMGRGALRRRSGRAARPAGPARAHSPHRSNMSPAADRDALGWCEERLLQPREPLQLARLFTPSARRGGATAIGVLYIELEAIARGQRDLNVARMNLGWWREELARLEAGEPAHPATRLLAENPGSPAI